MSGWMEKSPGRYLTSFLDLTKNVELSEGLFSGHLRHSREQKIPKFGLWRPKKLRKLEKGEKLSKMSCFVMAFSGVLEKNKLFSRLFHFAAMSSETTDGVLKTLFWV